MEITLEKSTEQAAIIKQMQDLVLNLDVNYLLECEKEMKSMHSFRDSAMILNPNPGTHFEKQELEALKIKQLGLYISLANNCSEILSATRSLQRSGLANKQLENLFK